MSILKKSSQEINDMFGENVGEEKLEENLDSILDEVNKILQAGGQDKLMLGKKFLRDLNTYERAYIFYKLGFNHHAGKMLIRILNNPSKKKNDKANALLDNMLANFDILPQFIIAQLFLHSREGDFNDEIDLDSNIRDLLIFLENNSDIKGCDEYKSILIGITFFPFDIEKVRSCFQQGNSPLSLLALGILDFLEHDNEKSLNSLLKIPENLGLLSIEAKKYIEMIQES